MGKKGYLCRYDTNFECTGNNCDECTNHPMYLKGKRATLIEILKATAGGDGLISKDEFNNAREHLTKLTREPYRGLEEERTLKMASKTMNKIQELLGEM